MKRMVNKNKALKSKMDQEEELIKNMRPRLDATSVKIVQEKRQAVRFGEDTLADSDIHNLKSTLNATEASELIETEGIFQNLSRIQQRYGQSTFGPIYKRYKVILEKKEAMIKKLRREVTEVKIA